MFLSNNSIENSKSILNDFKTNSSKYNLDDPQTNNALWTANYAVKSSVNIETGKIIPVYARMCSFVPMNIPIAFGLICLPATSFNIMLFNFLNQSYNAMMNYANSSGTEDSVRYAGMSFGLAVISSIGVGIFLKRKFPAQNVGVIREALLRFLPSMVAGFLNLFFMRSDYITKGINVRDEKGNIFGTSKICGAKACLEGAFSRVFLPMPLIINHFLLKRIKKLNLSRKTNLTIEISLCAIALGCGLPCSIAIFKEKSKIKPKYLETDLKDKAEKNQIEFLYYNKGL